MERHCHNARRLAEGLAEMPGIALDPANIRTNIVRFGVPDHAGGKIASLLKDEGVHINGGDSDLRMVTHYGVGSEDVEFALVAMRRVMAGVA